MQHLQPAKPRCLLPKQVQHVMLIGCGASEDLVKLLRLSDDSEARIIVADSHRCGVFSCSVALR
jgi:hypothetical protein